MLKIGDFSRIAHVSIKTLRHYAREGLLEPVWIDRFSGYRYYSLDQLPRLNRVLALKDLGFSLEQIRKLLGDDLAASELRGMLRLKQTELRLHLQQEHQRLIRVEKRLEQIETEGMTSDQDVILKPIAAYSAVSARTRAATVEQTNAAREGLRDMILRWCEVNKLRAVGSWFSMLESSSYNENNVEINLGVMIENGAKAGVNPSSGPVRVIRLKEVPLAACLLGKQETQQPQAELMKWIEANGYISCGETRLLFIGETAETPLEQQLIEIQTPVRCQLEKKEDATEQKENMMEPVKFETLPAFKVMGLKYRGKNENQEIAAMWGEFNKLADRVPNIGKCAFGVCTMLSDAPQGVFEYVAGFKVAADAVPLEGMVMVDVPENRYAVFEHRGSMELLGKTYKGIVNEWFPRSGMKPTGGYDMEVYTEEFKNFAPDSVFYIYEPVK